MEHLALGGTLCPVMIGRERELAALGRLLERAAGGSGSAALVLGEAGVGKSRLVGELAARAGELGLHALRGACTEAARGEPYAALLDLVRDELGALAPADVPTALGPLAPLLVGLLPEYAALLPAAPAPAALDPRQERQRVTQALVQHLEHAARRSPCLVIVEDLHWADEATLGVLLALARRAPRSALLLVGTCREEQAGPVLAELLETLARERSAALLRLGRLAYEQCDAMLRATFQQRRPIRGDFLAALYELTDGNPFFVEEVLGALVASGEIFVADGRWERRALAELHIPGSLQAAVERRLRGVGPGAAALARVAAVAGRRFDFELLLAATGEDEGELLAQVRELVARQLVVEEAPDRFAFRHALTAAALAGGLLARERRVVHARVAAGLEGLLARRGPEAAEAGAAELARHFAGAGEWGPALRYARVAAARSLRLFAPAAAAEQLTLALDAARELGLPPPPDLLRLRGGARETLGLGEEALADYRAALGRALAEGNRVEEWRTLLATGFAHAARDGAVMGDYLRRALALARELGDPVLLAQSLNRYGNWYLFLERPAQALAHHREALAIFEAAGDRAGLAATHDLLAVAHLMGADKVAAAAHYRSAIALFRELGDLTGLASALAAASLRGVAYHHTTVAPAEDGSADWLADAEEALHMTRRIGWRSGEANALVYLALLHGAAGEYGPALEHAAAAEELAAEIAHPVWITGAALAHAALLLDLLDHRGARAALEAVRPGAAGLGTFFARRVAACLAQACVLQGDLSAAAAALAPYDDSDDAGLLAQGPRLGWLARGELALASGEAGEALAIVGRLVATAVHAAERGPGCVPALWLLEGEALAALGRHVEAARSLAAAADWAGRLGLRPTRWRALAALGRTAHAAGRRAEARRAYAEARAIVDDLAARVPDGPLRATFLRRAGALLPRGSAELPTTASDPSAAQLTRREREVAALVAAGKTSREIAEALVLGERTVETHVGNILGKLGLASRREVAAWAAEAGLTPPDRTRG